MLIWSDGSADHIDIEFCFLFQDGEELPGEIMLSSLFNQAECAENFCTPKQVSVIVIKINRTVQDKVWGSVHLNKYMCLYFKFTIFSCNFRCSAALWRHLSFKNQTNQPRDAELPDFVPLSISRWIFLNRDMHHELN